MLRPLPAPGVLSARPLDGASTVAAPAPPHSAPSADATEFYEACDPGKDNLCLYGALPYLSPRATFSP